jgi:hypothetical protein
MKYVNPNHPCGTLSPQESGFLRGAGGFKQASDRPEFSVRLKTQPTKVTDTPMIAAGRKHLGKTIR